jgi:hypothetical protein
MRRGPAQTACSGGEQRLTSLTVRRGAAGGLGQVTGLPPPRAAAPARGSAQWQRLPQRRPPVGGSVEASDGAAALLGGDLDQRVGFCISLFPYKIVAPTPSLDLAYSN